MKKLMHKSTILPLGLIGVTAITGGVLRSTVVMADVVDEITITVPQSCTMTGSGMTSHTASITNGQYDSTIGETAVNVICNDNAGFAVYAIGYTDNTLGNNVLTSSTLGSTHDIATGTLTSGANSQWAMKLVPDSASSPAYPLIIAGSSADTLKAQGDPDFSSFQEVPSSYTKVAYRTTSTDAGAGATGSTFRTTYQVYISPTQAAGAYEGQVKYVLVHPSTAPTPTQPQQATAGCINYFANASDAVGTMGCQSASDNATVTLLASNFSRTGYGFAGWSDAYDYATNQNAHFYGPQEDITVPEGTTASGLSLYAVWVQSAGNLQDTTKVAELCGTGANALTTAPTDGTANLSSVSALTDQRDNQTYAIAKLADGNCWMIENLRLADTHQDGNNTVATTLTLANTNNPLNDGTNVTLKHNYTDTTTSNTLSATSSVAYNADTAPDGWCTYVNAACNDQSRLRTDNTANRATDNPNTNSDAMYSYGNYYNWYSATAGRGTYSFIIDNNSTAGDLCPAGWRLPKGGRKANVSVSDFWILSRVVIGADPANFANSNFYYTGTPEGTDASKAMRSYPNNYLYSGGVRGGSSTPGDTGNYWSSTTGSSHSASNNAYDLSLSSSSVSPGTHNSNKYSGRTLRCIAGS